MKKFWLNIAAAVAGFAAYIVVAFLANLVFTLLLKIPLLVRLLSWPSTPELYATTGAVTVSLIAAYGVGKWLCEKADGKRSWGVSILFTVITILYILSIISRIVAVGYSDSIWAWSIATIICIFVVVQSWKGAEL